MSKPRCFPHLVGVRLEPATFAELLVASKRTGIPCSVLAREILRGDRPALTERNVSARRRAALQEGSR